MESLKKICSHLEDGLLANVSGDMSCVDAKEVGEVADAIKDIKMALYYASIVDAMQEAEYGKDYDEGGRLYYSSRRRDSRGRYMYSEPMHDGMMDYNGMEYYSEPHYRMTPEMYKNRSAEEWRDMDKKQGRMYYTAPMHHFKKYYEHKGMADDNKKLESLEQDLKEISEEVTQLVGEMNNSEKQMLRTKLQTIAQKI